VFSSVTARRRKNVFPDSVIKVQKQKTKSQTIPQKFIESPFSPPHNLPVVKLRLIAKGALDRSST
jgi:hypothetical protein